MGIARAHSTAYPGGPPEGDVFVFNDVDRGLINGATMSPQPPETADRADPNSFVKVNGEWECE